MGVSVRETTAETRMVTARVMANSRKRRRRYRHEEKRNEDGDERDGERNDGEADLLGNLSERLAAANSPSSM